MSGNIRHGDKISVFTAGWFKDLGASFQSVIEPYTAGWFTKTTTTIIPQSIQEIDYVPGNHVISSKYSFNYKAFNPAANSLTKKCSSKYDGERELMQTLTQESVTKYGIATEYYQVGYDENPSDVDRIYGENTKRTILNVWQNVMVWHKLQRENRIWSKAGIESSDSFSTKTPKAHFQFVTNGYVPQAGDIIREIPTGRFFEVLEREEGDGDSVWLQSKQYMWELKVTLLTIDNTLYFPEEFKTTELYKMIIQGDPLDIAGDVEIKKENIIYKPTDSELPPQSPYMNW